MPAKNAKIHREKIQLKVDTLRRMVSNGPHLAKHQVLARVVALVTGKPYHSEVFSTTPGTQKSYLKEYNRDFKRWQSKKNGESYTELKKFIREQRLARPGEVLSQDRVLGLIIDYLNAPAPTPLPTLSAAAVRFSIENIIRKDTNGTKLAPIPQPVMATGDEQENDENEEIIDVVG